MAEKLSKYFEPIGSISSYFPKWCKIMNRHTHKLVEFILRKGPIIETDRLTILIVEDDSAIVSLVSLGLRYENFQVVTANNGLVGLQVFNEQNPDLVILDWLLPGMDGIKVCRMIRAQSDIPIIMITARDAITDRVNGLEAGADDYLVKPFHIDELIARVHARLRRRQSGEVSSLSYQDLSLNPETHEVFRNRHSIELTATEFKLLNYLMRHPRQVFSKEQILEEVWGYDFQGNANIVEQYVRSLRKKIGVPPLIQTVRGVGYVLREDSE
jgi:DNA-binding response OmpR family regulator